jgi:ribosomal protein L11 methyltransferase
LSHLSWLSVAIHTTAQIAEPLSDALLVEGALSVTVTDAADGAFQEQPIFGEPGEFAGYWNECVVTALFPAAADVAGALENACNALEIPLITVQRTTQVDEQDWVRLTQSQFEPIEVSPRLWIVPTWHQAPNPAAINLRLDPGRAFGTGSHPTTLLCLRWLDRHIQGGEILLDYGCGSGILAIAAAKLGAVQVIGTDIDPVALEVARRNASDNNVNANFQLPDQIPKLLADVTVANILANPLQMLAAIIIAKTQPGGWIVLSGILKNQAIGVMNHYRHAVDLQIDADESDWVCLAGKKNP